MNTRSAQLLDYLRLVRLPNVFTALADVTMGFLFVHHTLQPLGQFLPLAAASALLYSAGMVLNDVWDVELDRRERPERPLPAGRIAWRAARRLGWSLLIGGVLCAWLAGLLGGRDQFPPWRSGLIALLLAACVVLYDACLKRTWIGPLGMGACRFLNVLLGMSAVGAWNGPGAVAGWGPHHLLAAGGIGLYIVGVTWFARTEAGTSRRWTLAAATLVMAGAMVLLGALYGRLPRDFPRTMLDVNMWYLLLGVPAFVIVRRCLVAIVDPSPQRVQAAVRNCIWSLIVLDAAVSLLVSPVGWSFVVLSYLVPTVVLGQWIAST